MVNSKRGSTRSSLLAVVTEVTAQLAVVAIVKQAVANNMVEEEEKAET